MEPLIIVFIVGLFATGYAVYWVCLAAFVLVFGIIGSLFGAAAGPVAIGASGTALIGTILMTIPILHLTMTMTMKKGGMPTRATRID